MTLYTPGRGWDVGTYYRAMQTLRAGLDPYAVGLARQYAAQAAGQHAFAYVYPPLTLLALRAFNLLPLSMAAVLYWTIYSAGFVGQVWAGTQCFRPQDRAVMQYAVPLAIFFPGLMTGDVILSGNVACIFYGSIFTAAVLGWKRGIWRWFYLAVLLAGCFKLPLLTLLAIPLLSGERQWLKASGVAAAGLSLLALQSWLWPAQFREYLTSVGLQFQFNSDFGLSPAGVLGRVLYRHRLPYSTPTTVAFLIYGGALFAVLFYFSNLYRERRISAESWIPVLLVGTILLNPRIMQYDVQPIALPMALIVVRSVVSRSKAGMTLAVFVLFLIVIDLIGVSPTSLDDLRNMVVLVAVMALGLRYLAVEARRTCPGSLFISKLPAPSEAAAAGMDAYNPESRS
jgi:glycosyl transferase family 87